MPIVGIEIENFKGIADLQTVDLRPVTVFIGPNSSGKSSCIHALAALGQTVKLSNNLSPLTLDDEYASVHLGRWRDVLHSRNYREKLRLGIRLSNEEIVDYSHKGVGKSLSGEVTARYWFKCSLRTQEINIEAAEYEMGRVKYSIQRDGGRYRLTKSGSSSAGTLGRRGGFLMHEYSPTRLSGVRSRPEFFSFFRMQTLVHRALLGTLYLGPFRQAPRRRYPTRSVSPTEVGPEGESTITLLANEVIKKQKRPHLIEIARWLKRLGLANALDLARLGRSDLFDVNLTLADGAAFPIADLGYGLSQILPVLAQCSFAPAGSTLLFEQPELHLHPIAAKPLAEIFASASKDNRTIVLETHSPELVKGILQQVDAGTLKPKDIAVYLVKRENSRTLLTRASLDADGEIQDNWEQGVSKDW